MRRSMQLLDSWDSLIHLMIYSQPLARLERERSSTLSGQPLGCSFSQFESAVTGSRNSSSCESCRLFFLSLRRPCAILFIPYFCSSLSSHSPCLPYCALVPPPAAAIVVMVVSFSFSCVFVHQTHLPFVPSSHNCFGAAAVAVSCAFASARELFFSVLLFVVSVSDSGCVWLIRCDSPLPLLQCCVVGLLVS